MHVVLRPFRLASVPQNQRTEFLQRAAAQLAALKQRTYYLRNAYDAVQTPEEELVLLKAIMDMNEEGKSTYAAILESLVWLGEGEGQGGIGDGGKGVWATWVEEETWADLWKVGRFDAHVRARASVVEK